VTDSSASHETLDYTTEDRVASVTFARPEEGNSLSEQALNDLNDVVARVQADPSVRVLVITGRDGVFCTGVDGDVLEAAFSDLEYFEHVLTRVAATCLSLEALDVPVIAAIGGVASGAGFELALACDLIVVSDDAQIGDGHTAAGRVPGGGGTIRLPRLIGVQRARELIYSGRLLGGAEAAAIGLALRSVPAHALDAEVAALTAQFVDKPRHALAVCKRQINGGLGLDTHGGVEHERSEFIRYLHESGGDAAAGFRAGREDRPPAWS
jgi:enoyl-CoA hydratase/carnithine racemase